MLLKQEHDFQKGQIKFGETWQPYKPPTLLGIAIAPTQKRNYTQPLYIIQSR
jgi:hypothetical protein